MPNRIILGSKEREQKLTAARLRFETATSEMALEHRFGGPDSASTEIEIMKESTRLVREVRRDR